MLTGMTHTTGVWPPLLISHIGLVHSYSVCILTVSYNFKAGQLIPSIQIMLWVEQFMGSLSVTCVILCHNLHEEKLFQKWGLC